MFLFVNLLYVDYLVFYAVIFTDAETEMRKREFMDYLNSRFRNLWSTSFYPTKLCVFNL